MPRGKSTTVTVSPDGCTITLRHRIYFNSGDIDTLSLQRLARSAKENIERAWCPPGGFTCGACKVFFEFEWLTLEEGATRDDVDGKHIFYGRGMSFQEGYGPTRQAGVWFLQDGALPHAAHEVGHELGMRDKYRFVKFDAADPNNQSKWVEVNDPRGIGRGKENRLPADIKPATKDGYPEEGIAFDMNGKPLPVDVQEILTANGVTCDCGGHPKPRDHADERRDGPPRDGPPRDGDGDDKPPPDDADGNGKPPDGGLSSDGDMMPTPLPDDILIPSGSDSIPVELGPGDGLEHGDREEQPIIVVPGWMGSILMAGNMPVWPMWRPAYERQWKAMKDASVAKRATFLTPGVYNGLIAFIEKPRDQGGLERRKGDTYDVYPYDWTVSCRQSGRALARFIDEWLKEANWKRNYWGFKPFTSVDIIAHGFGGLVTRVAKHAGAKIDRQVFMGTPHYGSVSAYFALHPKIGTTEPLGVQPRAMTDAFGWWKTDNKADPAPDPKDFQRQLAMATDSAWEMLPDNRHIIFKNFFAVDGREYHRWQAIYTGDKNGPGVGEWALPALFHGTISEAMALKGVLGDRPAGVYLNIYSDEIWTPSKVTYDLGSVWSRQQENSGDGVVLGVSASGFSRKLKVKAGHHEMPGDGDVHGGIRVFLG
jgi:hypothetical protein